MFALKDPFCKAGTKLNSEKKNYIALHVRVFFKSVLHLIYHLRGNGLNSLF